VNGYLWNLVLANTSTPRGARFNGLFYDAVNEQLKLYRRGQLVASVISNDILYAGEMSAAEIATLGDLSCNTLTVITGAVSIDEVEYTFPADNGDSGEQLTTDGDGALTWSASGV
jgi:hypothetical protein